MCFFSLSSAGENVHARILNRNKAAFVMPYMPLCAVMMVKHTAMHVLLNVEKW